MAESVPALIVGSYLAPLGIFVSLYLDFTFWNWCLAEALDEEVERGAAFFMKSNFFYRNNVTLLKHSNGVGDELTEAKHICKQLSIRN